VSAATVRIPVPSSPALDTVSGALWTGAGAGPAVVLAHGAGTDRTNPVLLMVAEALAARGLGVLLFNFAYTELGRRGPDPAPRLEAVYRDVLVDARERFAGRDLLWGGRSMGGRIGSMVAAADGGCAGLVLLGYPLHPPGRPDRLRVDHWEQLRCPVLFVQGDRDPLCDLGLLAREREARLAAVPRLVHVVAGGDHG
jgi:uncharacterized protein